MRYKPFLVKTSDWKRSAEGFYSAQMAPASPSRSRHYRVTFHGNQIYLEPGRHESSALKKLFDQRPHFKEMHPTSRKSRLLFGDGDDEVEGDVELHNDLALVPAVAPSATSAALKKLVVATKVKVDGLEGTRLRDLAVAFYDLRSDTEVDRKELVAQELFTKWANAASEFITAVDDGNGRGRGFAVYAAKGGVVLADDTIVLASVFTGPSLPSKPIFDVMMSPLGRGLSGAPGDEVGFLKLLVWPSSGAKHLYAGTPAKVYLWRSHSLFYSRPDAR